jgi:hypothetical protein
MGFARRENARIECGSEFPQNCQRAIQIPPEKARAAQSCHCVINISARKQSHCWIFIHRIVIRGLKCHIVLYTTSRNVDQMRLNALRKHDPCSQVILYFISEWIAERTLVNSAQMLWLKPSPALTD